jgi:hypothetical protein
MGEEFETSDGDSNGPTRDESERPGTNGDGVDLETTYQSVLESACEESRDVLDQELSIQADIEDKAVWSVRTAVHDAVGAQYGGESHAGRFLIDAE